jgi:ParB-like chromosome segregation protein Spo0J
LDKIEIQYALIDDLQPADYNPRVDLQEGDSEFEKLKKSIQEFGFIDPIIYNTNTDRIIGGHQRWKAAKSLGMEKVPVVYVDLPEEKEKVLNIGLNKLGGAFDDAKLGELLSELEELNVDMSLTGLEDFEIDGYIASLDMHSENNLDDLDFKEEINGDESEEIDDGYEAPDGYVKYQVACTTEEREVIVRAVKHAKEKYGLITSNEALSEIAQLFLAKEMGE